ncbi:MAG: PrsW family glutamic-type intramembrane protease [Chloroflexi bacterium]|nr:PrsW family glutamic-type intramembrane protease [Chloroflexota bacterium]
MFLVVPIIVSLIPGLAWLWVFVNRDIYRHKSWRLIGLTFILGGISTIPAGVLNSYFIDESVFEGGLNFGTFAMQMLLVVGPVEEVSKFAAVWARAYHSTHFDEPMDGLVFAAAASLGFATVENVLYVLWFGAEVMIVRAPISTLGHVVFGSIWGYALARSFQKGQKGENRIITIAGGLLLAAGAHALFNTLLFGFPPGAFIMTAVGAVWVASRFRWAQQTSPFRFKQNYPNMPCPSCSQHIRVTSKYCRYCGKLVPDVDFRQVLLFCGSCGTSNGIRAKQCVSCDETLVLRKLRRAY